MILVTGAAGKTGQAILRALARRGADARALVRCAEHEPVVLAAGAKEIARGDLRDAETLAGAARGTAAIYHICPNVSPDEVEIGGAVAAAAKRSGTGRLVYHSVLHPQVKAMPHHWRKLRVEELLFTTDLDVTVLQPAVYMQNLRAHWQSIVEDGVYPVPYGVGSRLSLVDLEDVAEVAAKVLTEDGHAGAIYELCGREALDQQEVAAVLTDAVGRQVRAVNIPIGDWRRQARASDLDDDRWAALTAMFRYYDRHGLVGNSNVLHWLLDREPTSFRAFLERIADRREI
ncbi:MAG: NmrA family NAD(P)-binding protein [Thermoanaerobaculia bacterium]